VGVGRNSLTREEAVNIGVYSVGSQARVFFLHGASAPLRVEFLLKTDSGYPKDTGVNKPWQPLGIPFDFSGSARGSEIRF